jgi:hypothetical protein
VKDVDALTGDETPVTKTLVLDLDTLRGQNGIERMEMGIVSSWSMKRVRVSTVTRWCLLSPVVEPVGVRLKGR